MEMTTEEATHVRSQIVAALSACPPGAIARLITSDPTENVVIQAKATIRTPDGDVVIVVVLMHEANGPQPEGPAIPAEHYQDAATKGGMS